MNTLKKRIQGIGSEARKAYRQIIIDYIERDTLPDNHELHGVLMAMNKSYEDFEQDTRFVQKRKEAEATVKRSEEAQRKANEIREQMNELGPEVQQKLDQLELEYRKKKDELTKDLRQLEAAYHQASDESRDRLSAVMTLKETADPAIDQEDKRIADRIVTQRKKIESLEYDLSELDQEEIERGMVEEQTHIERLSEANTQYHELLLNEHRENLKKLEGQLSILKSRPGQITEAKEHLRELEEEREKNGLQKQQWKRFVIA